MFLFVLISEYTDQFLDNTKLSPCIFRPLDCGADIVVHTDGRTLSGHSDLAFGVLATNSDVYYHELKKHQDKYGVQAKPSDPECLRIHLSLPTLHARIETASKNALEVAKALIESKYVGRSNVCYPGLPIRYYGLPIYDPKEQNPIRSQHHNRTMDGGFLSFSPRGNIRSGMTFASVFCRETRLFKVTQLGRLGGTQSLCAHVIKKTPGMLSLIPPQTEYRGVLLSCGTEKSADLVNDVLQALEKANEALTTLEDLDELD